MTNSETQCWVRPSGRLDAGDIRGFARNCEDALPPEALAFLDRCAETVAALWLENFRLRADGGPGTMAMLAEAGIYEPTEEQVVFASTMRNPLLSWNDKVASLRAKWPPPAPESVPLATRKSKARKARRAGHG